MTSLGPVAPPAPPASTDADPGRDSTLLGRLVAWPGRHRPEILLVVLASVIPEVLTGSTPVFTLIDPIRDLGLLGFYGAGSLLIRDIALRWRKGWAAVLLLGLAYGIAEEGIATKTMVDPSSSAAGFLSVYGRLAGMNWVFAVVIALFHAIFSIALPILIVRLAYPSTRDVRFLSDQGEYWTLGILATTVGVGYLAFDPHYFEGYPLLGAFLLAIALLVVVVRTLPSGWLRAPTPSPTASPRWFAGLGILGALGWSVPYLILPHLIPFPIVPIALEIVSPIAVLYCGVRRAGRAGHERNAVYFAFGLLSWYIPWDLVITLALGDYLVGLVLAAVFYELYRIVRKYPESAVESPLTPPGTPVSPGAF
jgi:hypothetical protein